MSDENKESVVALLEEQMKLSEDFSRRNYGLKLGSDFPELARELLASRQITGKLFSDWLINRVKDSENVLDALKSSVSGPEQVVAASPEIYEPPLSFFYWGIQIGRELQRQQAAVLETIDKLRD